MAELVTRGGRQKVLRQSFKFMTPNEFIRYIENFEWTRQMNDVHGHHTYHPKRAAWEARGAERITAQVYTFHTGVNPVDGEYIGPPVRGGKVYHRHWSDFGQHGMIMPDGVVALGRSLNRPPASAVGHNGTSRVGPVMFELVGDLRDEYEGSPPDAQWEAFARIGHALQKKHDRPADAVMWHKEMARTACPGDISKDAYIARIKELSEQKQRVQAQPRPRPDTDPKPDVEEDAIETPYEELEIADDVWDVIETVLANGTPIGIGLRIARLFRNGW